MFLKAGIPIGKIDRIQPLLEKKWLSTYWQYIALIFKQEAARIRRELSVPGEVEMTRDVSVIFDGSTRQGEEIAVIAR